MLDKAGHDAGGSPAMTWTSPARQERLADGVSIANIKLMRAVSAGQVKAARKLIAGGKANPNAMLKLEDGATPLVYACLDSNLDMVRMLLALGADPNIPQADPLGFTSLHFCAR